MKKHSARCAFMMGLSLSTLAATMPAALAQAPAAGLEEIVVTARRRAEGAQAVPISIQAFSAESLEQRNVRELQDLSLVVPGFRFGSQGGKVNTDVILRGLSKIPLGVGVPAVVTYFADVALPGRGGNVPTYDIAGIQVLKGPQGTLFGRNTLGGAVVVTPEAPNYEVGGYVRGTYGTADRGDVEGAINLPIVDQTVALRAAGQIRRQDGLSKNLSGGPDFDNVDQNAARLSLLLNPADGVESTTVYDYFEADEAPSAGYLLRINPASLALLPPTLRTQITDYVAAGHRAGIHAAFTDLADGGSSKRHAWGISNDTSWDTGVMTVRNIFGYRKGAISSRIATTATGPLYIGPTPFTLFDASNTEDRKYLSNELQLLGTTWGDRLEWIGGVFYNSDESAGDNGTQFTSFSPGGVPAAAVTAHVKNTNKALFAQGTLDISQWTIDGLKLTMGARYSWDDVWACGGSMPGTGFMSVADCKDNVAAIGVGTLKTSGAAPSWGLSLDWQINADTLVYLSTRRGYRGANVNTPLFESQYTTGGTGCTGSLAPNCPDLRPFQTVDEETLTDVEIGVKNDWSIGDVQGRINVAAYISKYKDAVQFLNTAVFRLPVTTPDAPTGQSVGVNASDLTIKGVEMDLTVVPLPGLTLSLSAAYTDQTIDSVAPSPAAGLSLDKNQITLPSPEFSATFAFNWTIPLHPLDADLVLNGDYYHTDKFSGQVGENLPGYQLANFRLGWQDIARSGLSVATFLRNAFDEEYFASPVVLVRALPVSVVSPGEPRTWGVEATYRF